MVAMLKSVWTVAANGRTQKVAFSTEVEVTADTTEDTLEDVLEAIRLMVVEMFGENTLKCDWNSNEIFRIADKLAA